MRKNISMMQNLQTLVQRWGLIAGSLVGLMACTGSVVALAAGADTWQEEVLLHDGQKMVVERSQTYGGRSEPGQSGPIKEHRIRFTVPGTNRAVTWASEYGDDIGRTNFNLLAVHVKDGTPYVVAEPNLCLSYNKWGRPNPPYVFFKYDGTTWQRIQLEQLPTEFTTINVAHNTLGRDAQDLVRMGTVPVDKVQAMNKSRNPVYQQIVRGPINYDPECIPMVTNGKGLWLSQGLFSSKPTLDACIASCQREGFDEKACPCNKIFKEKSK